jgi:hypothetical protein
MAKKSKKSGGAAAAGPSNKDFKAGNIHDDVGEENEVGEAAEHNESGVKSEGDSQDEHEKRLTGDAEEGEDDEKDTMKVEMGDVGPRGCAINGHPIKEGMVVEMSVKDIKNHRDHGIPLLVVSDDDDRDVYDTSEPYVSPEGKEEAA